MPTGRRVRLVLQGRRGLPVLTARKVRRDHKVRLERMERKALSARLGLKVQSACKDRPVRQAQLGHRDRLARKGQ